MIDVCREIDTEKVDKFLKRGAELVMEMVDDRVLREPHNEIGAIQYGLTLLDRGHIREYDELLNKLKRLPDEYKQRVIYSRMEERLKNVIPENLELYADIYQELFGTSKPLHDAIKRALEFDSKDVKLWALSQTVKDKIVEPWVIELLEELVEIIPMERTAWTLAGYWPNFRFYLDFSLSPKARSVIALALLAGIERHRSPYRPLSLEVMGELSRIKPVGKPKENFLLMWAVSQLSILFSLSGEARRHGERDWRVMLSLPDIANPNVKAMINKNVSFIKDFCETFSSENEPFIRFLVAIFEFLLKPHNPEKYIDISKLFQREEKSAFRPIRIVQSFLRLPPAGEEDVYSYHNDLYTLYKHYKSEEQYKEDIEELNELINKNSKSIRNHPYKLLVWINSGCDPEIEKFLDTEILSELKLWLQQRGFTENVFHLCRWALRVISDLELCELVLEIVERQLTEGQKRVRVGHMVACYEWHKPKTKQELMVASRLKHIFEEVLANYPTGIDPEHRQLGILYCSALSAGVVEEKYMAELYKIFHTSPDFPSIRWYSERVESARSTLVKMLQSESFEVSRLAAVTLLDVSEAIYILHGRKRFIKETWIAEKYWEFAKDKEDTWRPRYIEGMARCQLKWAKNSQKWLNAIKEANTEELQRAWCRTIEEADYCDVKDQDALFDLLLHILESGDPFAKAIRFAALRRLEEMISELEPVEFDEERLNSPLSRRARLLFSG